MTKRKITEQNKLNEAISAFLDTYLTTLKEKRKAKTNKDLDTRPTTQAELFDFAVAELKDRADIDSKISPQINNVKDKLSEILTFFDEWAKEAAAQKTSAPTTTPNPAGRLTPNTTYRTLSNPREDERKDGHTLTTSSLTSTTSAATSTTTTRVTPITSKIPGSVGSLGTDPTPPPVLETQESADQKAARELAAAQQRSAESSYIAVAEKILAQLKEDLSSGRVSAISFHANALSIDKMVHVRAAIETTIQKDYAQKDWYKADLKPAYDCTEYNLSVQNIVDAYEAHIRASLFKLLDACNTKLDEMVTEITRLDPASKNHISLTEQWESTPSPIFTQLKQRLSNDSTLTALFKLFSNAFSDDIRTQLSPKVEAVQKAASEFSKRIAEHDARKKLERSAAPTGPILSNASAFSAPSVDISLSPAAPTALPAASPTPTSNPNASVNSRSLREVYGEYCERFQKCTHIDEAKKLLHLNSELFFSDQNIFFQHLIDAVSKENPVWDSIYFRSLAETSILTKQTYDTYKNHYDCLRALNLLNLLVQWHTDNENSLYPSLRPVAKSWIQKLIVEDNKNGRHNEVSDLAIQTRVLLENIVAADVEKFKLNIHEYRAALKKASGYPSELRQAFAQFLNVVAWTCFILTALMATNLILTFAGLALAITLPLAETFTVYALATTGGIAVAAKTGSFFAGRSYGLARDAETFGQAALEVCNAKGNLKAPLPTPAAEPKTPELPSTPATPTMVSAT